MKAMAAHAVAPSDCSNARVKHRDLAQDGASAPDLRVVVHAEEWVVPYWRGVRTLSGRASVVLRNGLMSRPPRRV